jgi:hypothetical protein
MKRTSILVFTLFYFTFTFAQNSFEALDLSANNALHIDADERLDYGLNGTIDLGFRINEEKLVELPNANTLKNLYKTDTLAYQCLISNASFTQTKFAIMLNRSSTRIGLYDGQVFKSVPFNFLVNTDFHVIFSTKVDQTEVYVNGRKIGTISLGYAKNISLPLHIGSSGKGIKSFNGTINWARLWNIPFEKDLVNNQSFRKPNIPDLSSKVLDNLVGYTIFSNENSSFYFYHDQFFTHNKFGLFGDKTQRVYFPETGKIKEIKIEFQGNYIQDISFICEDDNTKSTVTYNLSGAEKLGNNTLSFVLKSNEFVLGFAGSYDENGMMSMRIITNLGASPLLTKASSMGYYSFLEKIPPSNQLKVCKAEITKNRVVGLQFQSNFSNYKAIIPYGLFKRTDKNMPVLDHEKIANLENDRFKDPRDGRIHLHGNYTSPEIYKFYYNPENGSITQIAETLKNKDTNLTEISEPVTYKYNRDNIWTSGSQNLVMQDEETFILYGADQSMAYNIFKKSEVSSSTQASNDKIKWGGTFSLDQRPPLLAYNFAGYNLAKMDYKDFQVNTGADKNIFKMPDENSQDYYFAANGKILPNGIIFKNDRHGFNRARSHTISTEEEHKKAWNMNVGFSIGVPDAMSFGLNYSHKESVDKMRSTNKMHGVSITQEALYGLVLDKSKIELSPDFLDMIYLIRDTYLKFGDRDYEQYLSNSRANLYYFYTWLISTYGTHYAYAVTYGGSAYQEFELSGKQTQITKEQGTEISAEMSGTAEGVQGGINGGGGNSSKDLDGDGIEDKISNIETIGGSLSSGQDGGSWSLHDGSEVPIMLDLRPIYELLSPVFFDDPIIYTDMREGLTLALNKYQEVNDQDLISWVLPPKEYVIEYNVHFNKLTDINKLNLIGKIGFSTNQVVPPLQNELFFLPTVFDKNQNNSLSMVTLQKQSILPLVQKNRVKLLISPDEFCNAQLRISNDFADVPLTDEDFTIFQNGSDLQKGLLGLKIGPQLILREVENILMNKSTGPSDKINSEKIIDIKNIDSILNKKQIFNSAHKDLIITIDYTITKTNTGAQNDWTLPCN